MQVNRSLSVQNASLAGTQRAATRGGTAENQSRQLLQTQSIAENPVDKATDPDAIDAGDPTDDRRGDGRQMLDLSQRGSLTGDQNGNTPRPLEPSIQGGKFVDYKA